MPDSFSDFSGDTFLANTGFALRIAMLEALFPICTENLKEDYENCSAHRSAPDSFSFLGK